MSGGTHEILERALIRVGFKPDPRIDGWRWFVIVDGHRVNIEFLCDVGEQPANVTIRRDGAALGAANVRGTRFVEEDWVAEEIEAQLVTRDETAKVNVRFAGLEGYLLAKAHAILYRGEQKDYYDFVYVLIYNRIGGPVAAANALRKGKFAQTIASAGRLWDEISSRYGWPSDVGAASFAAQGIQADPSSDEARLRQDAVAAVKEFIAALR